MVLALTAQVVTGLFAEDDALFHSGPLASEVSSDTVVMMTGYHNLFAKVVLVLVALHVAAIVFYLVWKRENLVAPHVAREEMGEGPAGERRVAQGSIRSHAARVRDASAGRRESRRHHPSAVTGSIILRTSVTREAGNPLRSACSWMSASSSAR